MRDGEAGAAAPAEEVEIVPAVQVPSETLLDFYRHTLAPQQLEDRWRWRYRTELPGNPFPLVLLRDGRALGHAGGMPFQLRLGGRTYRATWFVDFAIRSDWQRRGLGSRLTRAWMAASGVSVTFCNEDSMTVFARLGWTGSLDTHLHVFWVKPFDHPRAERFGRRGRSVLNRLAAPALRRQRRQFQIASPQLDTVYTFDGGDGLDADDSDIVAPLRDPPYWSWRVDGSPDRDRYRIYRERGVTLLVKLRDDRRSSIDVLWTSDTRDSAAETVRGMIAGLTTWAIDHGFSCVRMYAPSPAFDRALRALLPMVARPRFAFYSADREVMGHLARGRWRWQLIDSDFEWI
jgi:GNAT superfamily N-acetyltransferase